MNKHIQDSPLLVMEREYGLISLDVLLFLDTEGIILDVNNSALQTFGKNREDLLGTRFCDIFNDPVKAGNALVQVLNNGEVRDYELVMEPKDNDNTILNFNISICKDRTGCGCFCSGS
ncbi:MAG: PAS domain-containing protein [Methanosarcinales archaeon]|nr:PAS domain-containing protein [Methanosarcinales archaeon]